MSRTKLAMATALLGVGIFLTPALHANAGMSTGTWRYFPYGVPSPGYYGYRGDGYYGRHDVYGYNDRYRYRHWRRYHRYYDDDED